ncbi:KR domain-containing protein [Zopfia rhizophila CBS 207.26]|uniref:KR domain-containing protein n=1 Tax=Zopfia rhizophila CBS 207.26 TaxID=1314779 RepID=A0A6A6DMN7_9PEZI|nr:KR domain-containing protein [Zopfia rhizophila CBS 207.26]
MPSTIPPEPPAPIAIIGLACRFPGDATNPSKFWDLLKEGRSAYTPKSNRYNEDAFHHPGGDNKRQNVLPVRGGYLLKQDPYVFDAAFFNITAAEAMAFDPKQRIAMEVVYEAVENAGLGLQGVRGTQTACYMGTSMSDYRDSIVRDFGNYPKYHLLGTSDEMISNRVSHFFDLHGPSATIETACSSSHVATHLACQSLQSGESEMAIAGGVGMLLVPESTMQLNNLGFLSPLGQSRAFDSKAGGYARGEGCGVIVMKRLDQAIKDGDTIRAVIRGSGVNQDGWTQGVTMPSGDAQAALIRYVYDSNRLDYGATQYVEAHGTGTQAGDPEEAKALSQTIGVEGQKTHPSRKKLWIGSNKPNIGHLESAAGAASIIKGILAMEHGLIPPSIHFDEVNPKIKLDEWGLAVPTKPTPWPACEVKRMSTSAFGMGGTNAHIVLESYQNNASTNGFANGNGLLDDKPRKRLFTFSCHDQAGFKRLGSTLAEYLDEARPATTSDPEFLANFAHTLAAGRSGLSWKASCIADNATELREYISAALGDNATRTSTSSQPRIGFVFTGQGAQWAQMGVEMLQREVFSESVAKSATFLRALGCEWDPVTELSRPQAESLLAIPAISQPICTILQIALVDEARSWGIRPTKVVGHSSGEIAAAYCIGALTHEDAIAVAFHRGQTSALLKGRNGGMMAVGLSRTEAEKVLADGKFSATVACVNSPLNVTLSGDASALDAVKVVLHQRGVFARHLKVEVAYHSSHMRACSAKYGAAIADIETRIPENGDENIVMVSSVTGEPAEPELLGPYYWVQNLISPVLFADAVKELAIGDGTGNAVDILVEIGPHSALAGPTEQTLSHHDIKNIHYTSMLTRGQDAIDTSLNLSGELFRHGVTLNIPGVNGDAHSHRLTDLPPYPWNHTQKFRAESRIQRELVAQKYPTKGILGAPMPSMDEAERVWRGFIRLDEEPWLRDHAVGSTVLFPAAGVMSVVFEAAQQIQDPGKTPRSYTLRDVSFTAIIALTDGTATELILHIRPHLVATTGPTSASWWEFTVSSCAGVTGQLRQNCRGLLAINYADQISPQMILEDEQTNTSRLADYRRILRNHPDTCSKDLFYDTLAKSALQYGETFQGVEYCRPGNGESSFGVAITDIGETFSKNKVKRPFLIHGATLDSVLQAWMSSTKDSNGPGSFGFSMPMLPKSIGELEISLDIPDTVGYTMPGFCRSRKHGFNEWSADLTMLDKELSKSFLSITDFRLAELEMDDAGKHDQAADAARADPASIASRTHWNYAMDMLSSAEIAKVVLRAGGADPTESILELIRMAIHQRPAAQVVELVLDTEHLHKTIVSQLSKDFIHASQIRYVVVKGAVDNADVDTEKLFGEAFALDALEAASAGQILPADIFLVTHHVSAMLGKELEGILERMLRMAKSDAQVIMVDCSGLPPKTSALTAKGLELKSRISLEGESLMLFSPGKSNLANGVKREEIFILEPLEPSPEVQSLSTALLGLLETKGHLVSIVAGFPKGSIETKTIVSLLEFEHSILENLSAEEFEDVRHLALNAQRLLWITRGNNPSLRVVDGFARTIGNELTSASFQILKLEDADAEKSAELVTRLLSSHSSDKEYQEHDNLLQVSRLYRDETENDHIRTHLSDSVRTMSLPTDRALHLAVGKPGLLDTLRFVPEELAPLADDEVELQVKASGVNFRDIMGSMGMLAVNGIGQEASGVVIRTGKLGAEFLKPGDRVSTLCVSGTHATITRCDYRVAQKIPDSMSFEEAAGIPVTHCTAYYALNKIAKLQKGQSILIHAAAGGTGQAAVQLAKHLGLAVFVTVGTDDKRHLMTDTYGIPDEHIFNSRDSSFVRGVKRMTQGRGVDCVLNSLSGELLRLSFDCLAMFGTFVEIGLRDITDNTRLEMRPFSRSTTFSFINMVSFLQEAPHAMGEILADVFKLLESGALRPASPLTVYPVGQVEDAFRLMQQGKHRGKMVLSFTQSDAKAPVLCRAKDSLKLDPQATYLIVGGLGGLGRSLATEFAASGARHIAFLSRSGDSNPEAKAVIDSLTALGVQAKAYRGDVSDEASFQEAMKQCAEQLPPVRGVIQMAMVLRDVVFEKMTYEDWVTGLRPKVQGSWNLHKYFDQPSLDFMVFCSSISGINGNPGQAQYAAGNTYQDALASYRRIRGLPAVSVNLGIMRDVGVIAEGVANAFTPYEEALGIREPAFHALMKSLINGQLANSSYLGGGGCPAQVTVGLGTGDIFTTFGINPPSYFSDPRFGPLGVTSTLTNAASGTSDSAAASLASRLIEVSSTNDPAAANSIITNALVRKMADILRMPPSEVDASRPMYQYGVDSLVALEVRNWIAKEMKANMALLEILAAVPMETFAEQIAKKSKLLTGAA